jgi:pimeloyl-ACP methyl ester carboxylesterase
MGVVIDLLLPHLGENVEDGRIVVWLKKPGEGFRRGEAILEVETDKTVVEVPALETGKLVEIIAEVDARIAVDTPIARIEVDKSAAKTQAPTKAARKPVAKAKKSRKIVKPSVSAAGRTLATPIARRLAAEFGLELAGLQGSGRRGRITRDDVMAAADGPIAAKPGMSEAIVDTAFGGIFVKRWTPARKNAPATLVLIHGAFADTDAWNATASAMVRAGIEVIVLDLPAHGKSPSSVTAFADVVAAAAEAIRKTSSGPLALVGHSLGGAVAARLAALPDLPVASLTLIAPMGLGEETDQGFFDAMLKAGSDAALAETMAKLTATGMLPSAAYLSDLRTRLKTRSKDLRGQMRGVCVKGKQKIAIADDLSLLAVPVSVVWGRQDAVLPWRQALNAPARCALHLVPKTGHMPQWERGALIAEILKRAAGT